ncbi:efflux RND transporter permease subunit [Nonomuraea sp. KM88]|uniref:efflux RND transporter permease subunit n=1 Tax=Nonomuraea sp. KM88 TaxID=3457427 RepID=UPI003FCD894F
MTAFARLSLVNRSLVILIAVVLSAFGVFAIPQLKQQLLPSLSFPGAFVVAPFAGASPEIVEDQVTKPIEDSFQGLAGMEQMTSTSKEGLAQIQVAFEYGTDVESSVNKMQQAINRVTLPEGVEPQVVAGNTDDIPVLVLAVGDGGDERSMADKLRRILVPELQGVEGVREVSVTGTREEVVTIEPDARKMALAGVSAAQIPEVLKANGTPIPAGTLIDDGKALTVQVGSRVDSVSELESLYLTPAPPAAAPQQARPQQSQQSQQQGQRQSPQQGQAQGRPGQGAVAQQPARPKPLKPVKLGDVAEIKRGLAEATTLTRTDGRSSLGVAVTMTPDGNAVTISHDVREKLPELTRALGDSSDTAVSVVFDQAPYVEESIESLTTEGLLGLVFAVLVILVFLLSVRSTVVTAVSIPLSVVIALLALWAGDYSLNMLTLGALTIAVGRVVDDSIVVLENIKRHLGYGEAKLQAILTAVREVSGAVTASTLTTVAVFAPIAIVGGMVGELFSPFAITVAVALLASLVVSLTVVPVLAYWFLKAPALTPEQARKQREEAEAKELRSPLQRSYLPVLRFATRFKLVTVLIGVAVFVGTMGLAGGLQTNFLDASGQNTISLSQRMPVGTDLKTTDEAAQKVEEVLAGLDGVETYQVNVGGGNAMSGGAVGGGADRASYSVTLEEGADTVRVEQALRDEVAGLSGVGEVTVGAQAAGFASDTIDVIVQASEAEALRAATDTVAAAMGEVSGLKDVSSDLESSAPRVEVVVDRAEAAERGLSEAQVGQAVAQAFRGAPLGQIMLDGRASDLVLRGADAPEDVEAIEGLKLPTPAGMVKLSSVADVREVAGPTQVSRIDGERSATVSAKADAADLGSVTQALTTKLDGLSLAAGVSYEIGGVSADQADAFADLGLAMLAAIAIVFLIMVATFRSFVQPLILLVSIPFAATGAVGLLVATDTALGVPALIGMLMLIGIVVTNAIVLIDLINQYRDQGMGVVEAVIEGGRRRLRPILMTAVATICALTPMALGVTGSGGFISQPLAIVVIGGLISSTLLTLVLVPTLYVVVTRKGGEQGRGPVGPRVREDAGGAGAQDLAGHPA